MTVVHLLTGSCGARSMGRGLVTEDLSKVTCRSCRNAAVRYPLSSLAELLGITVPALLGRLKVSAPERKRYEAGVTELVADRMAARFGLVAYEVWPEILDDAITDMERVCAAAGCTTRFVPPARVPNKVFCSTACKSRSQRTRRYWEDEAFRERVKAASRRYYEETRDWQIERHRRIRAEARRRAA